MALKIRQNELFASCQRLKITHLKKRPVKRKRREIEKEDHTDNSVLMGIAVINVCDTVRMKNCSKSDANGVIDVMICDPQFIITDVVAKWPGSVHDSRIFRESSIYASFENDCVNGTYGPECYKTCHCLEGPCDAITGTCGTGCKRGWRGAACNETCADGSYGTNCSLTCSAFCRNNRPCHHINGTCIEGCADGYEFSTDKTCNTPCATGLYGHNCSSTCSAFCRSNRSCHNVIGMCLYGCEDGYNFVTDNTCKTTCAAGSYGTNCALTCSEFCRNNRQCHHINGTCVDGCEDGYDFFTDKTCNTPCGHRRYGRDCSSICSEYCHNKQTCHHINGTCPNGCGDGYDFNRDKTCNATCKHRTFGKNCSMDCNCDECHHINGSCAIFKQQCDTGFKMDKDICQPCGQRRYGQNCSTECHCERCHNVNGSCALYSSYCDMGYRMENDLCIENSEASSKLSSFSTGAIGGGVAAAVTVTIVIIVAVKLPAGLIRKHDVASAESNKGKNRYKEMYAYDDSRVVLTSECPDDSDYINASYIHLKCLQYWPEDINGECKHGGVLIKYVGIKETFDYNIRSLEITKYGETRRLNQFHFKSWPDNDVPETTWSLVDFWRAVAKCDDTSTSPILVHCSSGVGPSGTFIALDNLIAQAQIENCVRPLHVVEVLRQQRVNMVQTKEQYKYLHEALAEVLLIGTNYWVTRQFESIYNLMIGKDIESSKTRIEQQFELITKSAYYARGQNAAIATGLVNDHIGTQNEAMIMKATESKPQCIVLSALGESRAFIALTSLHDDTAENFWSLVGKQACKTMIEFSNRSEGSREHIPIKKTK
ncbi:uncharacterized protein LOC127863823 [Dreissena polymorpha]|uniref:uncharacterized protein LOC127863823 n=1 Tax=Dreissena polymorpha TaxID=45954 RepID=UPI002263BED2|nr:uncharacterized protein LOC127863823 [Dreissena polymorpha]